MLCAVGKSEFSFGCLADVLIIYMCPLRRHIHYGIAVVVVAHVKCAHHGTFDIAGIIPLPAVVVAIDMPYHGVVRQYGKIGLIVVEVVLQRIVVERQHFLTGCDIFVKCGAQPVQVFLFDVAVAHLHKGAAVYAYYHQRILLENEAVAAECVDDGLCGRLRPVVLMVARKHIEREAYLLKYIVHIGNLFVGTLVGEVAVHYHCIVVAFVHFGYCLTKFGVVCVARCHMYVAEHHKTLRLHGDTRQCQSQSKH